MQLTRMREWLESLSDDEVEAEVDKTYGAGTWAWLDHEIATAGGADVGMDELWQRYCQWRATRESND
jgi:hypothetical protein